MLAVQIVVGECPAGVCLHDGDIVIMMPVDVVDSAAVDVEGFAQIVHGHGAAFDVPAWSAFSMFGLPKNVSVVWCPGFPEGEVLSFFFRVLVCFDSFARFEFLKADVAEFAVVFEFVDGVVD